MLRWIWCGVSKLDKIGNEIVRESLGVANIAEEMRENRFKCLGYVERRNNDGYNREGRGEIKVEENRERSSRRQTRSGWRLFGEFMRVCGGYMVKDREK